MEQKLLHILQHSVGADQYGMGGGHRNHFATSPGGKDYESCCILAEMGLMQNNGSRPQIYGALEFFSVTRKGLEAISSESPLPPPKPKLTRSQKRYKRFLEYGDMFDSFIDFCRWDAEPARPWNGG